MLNLDSPKTLCTSSWFHLPRQSLITTDAPGTAAILGQTLVVKGTVLDQSPAQPGTPYISAPSMSQVQML